MKKVLALLSFALVCSLTTMAQGGGGGMDPAQMLEMMKQRVKPQLIEKTKLTDAQADKVLEIQVAAQGQMRGMRDLSEDQRAAKMKEVNDEKEKKFKAIPLTDDQIKAVNDFYEEMRKARAAQGGGRGPGGK
jgi:Spy/CpxP family protein refolding chaperone